MRGPPAIELLFLISGRIRIVGEQRIHDAFQLGSCATARHRLRDNRNPIDRSRNCLFDDIVDQVGIHSIKHWSVSFATSNDDGSENNKNSWRPQKRSRNLIPKNEVVPSDSAERDHNGGAP